MHQEPSGNQWEKQKCDTPITDIHVQKRKILLEQTRTPLWVEFSPSPVDFGICTSTFFLVNSWPHTYHRAYFYYEFACMLYLETFENLVVVRILLAAAKHDDEPGCNLHQASEAKWVFKDMVNNP